MIEINNQQDQQDQTTQSNQTEQSTTEVPLTWENALQTPMTRICDCKKELYTHEVCYCKRAKDPYAAYK